MSDNRWTRPNRLTRVTHQGICERVVTDNDHPALGFFGEVLNDSEHLVHLKPGDHYWSLHTRTKTGLDSEGFDLQYFATRPQAEEALRNAPVGTEYGEAADHYPRFMEIGETEVDALLRVRSTEIWTGIWEALKGSKVIGEDDKISKSVVDWVGAEHIEWMKKTCEEHWCKQIPEERWWAPAILEYCLNHFPASSLATIGAKLYFLLYCSETSYASGVSSGYLQREFEAIYHGSEELAQTTANTRKKAGDGGGGVSNAKRLERLEALMTEVEKLSGLAGHISEERILAQAWDNLEQARPDTPATPSTRFKYEVDLRSLDAFAARYRAVFGEGA